MHTLALHHHQIDSQDIARLSMKLIDSQITEYDRLLSLKNSLNQPKFVEAISGTKTRICMTKRKYDGCFLAEDPFDKAIIDDNGEDNNLIDSAEVSDISGVSDGKKDYEAVMDFVIKFKEEREKDGKRMDWTACLEKRVEFVELQNAPERSSINT